MAIENLVLLCGFEDADIGGARVLSSNSLFIEMPKGSRGIRLTKRELRRMIECLDETPPTPY